MLKIFARKHKHHLSAFVILIIIAAVSGYFAFRPNITQNSINKTQTTATDQTPDEIISNQLLVIGDDTTSTTLIQITDGTQNSPTTTSSTSTTISTPSTTPDTNYYLLITNDSEASTTVHDLMNKLKSEDKLSFSGREYPGMGMFVEEINGVRNDNLTGKYWIYYINGQSAQVGISSYIIKPNDVIEWKYENAKF